MDNCEVNLLATTDAKVWAEEWYRIFVRPESLSDGDYVGWMIGWFANAFEAQEFVDAQRIAELEAEVERWEYKACANGWKAEHDRAEASEAKLEQVQGLLDATPSFKDIPRESLAAVLKEEGK